MLRNAWGYSLSSVITTRASRVRKGCCLALILIACAACQTSRTSIAEQRGTGLLGPAGSYITAGQPSADPGEVTGSASTKPVGFTESPGTSRELASASARIIPSGNGEGFILNFVDVELQEFVRLAFDEVFRETVLVDPALRGRITVRTTEPLPKSDALALTREALKTVGAKLSKLNGVWSVTAAAAGANDGGVIRIVPMRHLDGADAKQALQQVAGPGVQLAVAGRGRYLVVGGDASSVENVQNTLTALDIDELQDRTFSLVPLQQASASGVSNDLAKMFGAENRSNIQIFPIERMNAVMLVSPSTEMISRAKNWILHLDQAGEERRTYVYPVKNRRAADIAKVLDGMMRRGSDKREPASDTVAPGLTPEKIDITASIEANVNPEQNYKPANLEAEEFGVQVRADIATNTLVIIARADEYRLVESAIRNLDILPTQVLIEATIAEVSLNDTLRHGVRYFFKDSPHSASLTSSEIGAIDPVFPGFNYTYKVANARVVLSALEEVTDVEVVSSPALTVLDNQTATLKVGDQVPIATRSARSVTDPDAPIVNDIELKDTGVILAVTPRVSAGGIVMLDIKQEASDVVPTTTSSIDSPTIRQREIVSTVAVQSGSEIVLGGIITRKDKRGRQGLPFLKDIPLLGEAFTSDRKIERGRTELLIIIRPVVMRSNSDVRAVTDEIKQRLIGLGNY